MRGSTPRRAGQCRQRPDVFRKAASAVAHAGKEEGEADSGVVADAAADLVDVGRRALAEIRHLVDEADLCGKQGIGHVLRHLGALGRHDQKGFLGPQVGLIQIRQRFGHLGAPDAHHDAVGLHKIVDRHPLLEKLGIAGHVDLPAGQLFEPRGAWHWCPPARCSCRRQSRRGPGAGRSDRRPTRGPKGRPNRRRPAACPQPETAAGPSSPPRAN